jgi:hypothetical protein
LADKQQLPQREGEEMQTLTWCALMGYHQGMTISIFAVGRPSRQYQVDLPQPTVHDLIHRDPLQGRFVGFNRLDTKWQEVIDLAIQGLAQIMVEGRGYKFDTLNPETGEFTFKAG